MQFNTLEHKPPNSYHCNPLFHRERSRKAVGSIQSQLADSRLNNISVSKRL